MMSRQLLTPRARLEQACRTLAMDDWFRVNPGSQRCRRARSAAAKEVNGRPGITGGAGCRWWVDRTEWNESILLLRAPRRQARRPREAVNEGLDVRSHLIRGP